MLSCDKQMLFGKVPAAEDHDYGLSLTFAVYLSLRFRPLHTCPSPYKAVTKGGESDQKKDLRRNTNFLLQQLNMAKILLLCLVAATLLAFTGGLLVMH